MDTEIIRPQRGELLTVVLGVLGTILVVSVLLGDGWRHALAVVPWLVLVVGACWAAFMRPRIEVADGGIRIVNVLRTIDIQWPAVTAIETRYMLTIVTAYGEFVAWSAPTEGRRGAARTRARAATDGLETLGFAATDVDALADTTDGEPTVGVGDLPASASGGAALTIRRRWHELRQAGHLDNPRLEKQRATVTWHWQLVAAAALLIVAGIALR